MRDEMRVMRDEARGVLVLISIALISLSVHSEPSHSIPHPSTSSLNLIPQPHPSSGYTNHAGNVIAGFPIALTQTHVTLSASHPSTSSLIPLSIFPESEQRRIAADFGEPRVPLAVKRAIAGAEKAMARSRKRAEKGLCTKEESEAFCAKSSAALRAYLDREVESGAITPGERKALGR